MLAIIAIAAAALFVPPWITGSIAQRALVELSQHPLAPEISIARYRRGLFRSDVILQIEHRGGPPSVVSLDLRHGPLLPRSRCGGALGVAVANVELLPTQEDREIVRLYGPDALDLGCLYTDLLGEASAELRLPGHATTTLAHYGEDHEFGWGEVSLRLGEVDGALLLRAETEQLDYNALFPVPGSEQMAGRPMYGEWAHQLRGVTLTQELRLAGPDYTIRSELRIASANVTRRVLRPDTFVELHDLRLVSDLSELDGMMDWDGLAAWDAFILPSGHVAAGELPLQLLNLDAAAMRTLRTSGDELARAAALEALIAGGPIARLGPARQSSDSGELMMDLILSLPPIPDQRMLDPTATLRTLSGEASFELPTEMAYEVLRLALQDQVSEEWARRERRPSAYQLESLARQRFDGALERYRGRGLLRLEDDRILVELSLIEGLLRSSDAEEPLLDVLEWLGILRLDARGEVET